MPKNSRKMPAKATSPNTTGTERDGMGKPPKGSVELIGRWFWRRFEKAFGHFFALRPQVFHSHRQQPGRGVVPDCLAFGADAELLENKELLELDIAVFDSGDLGHADDAADTTTQPGLLNDQVDGGPDRLPDSPRRQVLSRLEHKGLETDQALVRVVGVDRGHRTIVAGVHGLEHVQRLTTSTLTDDDPVGSHTQTALDELADGHRAFAFHVRRTRLELDPVRLLKLELRGVLTRDQPFGLRNEGREDVEERGLTGASASRNEDVEPRAHTGTQERHELRARRPEPVDDVGGTPLLFGELSDREARAFERNRRDDDVDSGAVLQAGVADRRRFVDAPAHQADDAVDDLAHLALALEGHGREGRLAGLLNVDLRSE